MTIYQTKCPKCGHEDAVFVRTSDVKKYEEGALIQNAFPYLNNNQRELIKTGICSPCWSKIFPVLKEDANEETQTLDQ